MRYALCYDIDQCSKRPCSPAGGYAFRILASRVTLNSGNVASWIDELGHNPTQATPGSQALWVASDPLFLGKPVVRYDGVDDLHQALFTLPQPAQIQIVGRWTVPIGTNAGTMLDGGTADSARFIRVGATVLRQRAGAVPANNDQGGQTPESVHVYTLDFNGAASRLYTDNVLQGGSVDLSTLALGGITLGSYGGAFNYGQVDIAEVIVYPSIQSSGVLLQNAAYFKATYGSP